MMCTIVTASLLSGGLHAILLTEAYDLKIYRSCFMAFSETFSDILSWLVMTNITVVKRLSFLFRHFSTFFVIASRSLAGSI